MAGASDKIVACLGSHQWVKLLDDELDILEPSLFLHIRELGLQAIPAALLRKVVWEKLRRADTGS